MKTNTHKIDVKDDGGRMNAEKKHSFLHTDEGNAADFFKKIGIRNVNKRLQYEFGPNYGINIESKLGEYTIMTIQIPIQKEEVLPNV